MNILDKRNNQIKRFQYFLGIVTVVFPTEVTTEEATMVDSASPIVDGTTIGTYFTHSFYINFDQSYFNAICI